MRSASGILAFAGESFSIASVMWILAATLLQKDNEVPIPGLAFTLLLTALCIVIYLLILQRSISIPVLAAVSAGLLAVHITAYIHYYKGPILVGYVMTVILVSAICVYVPLYYCIREQPLTKHLIHIDVMIFSLIWLFLFLSVLTVSTLSIVCAVLVTLLDIGGAVCLRMSEGGMNEGTGKAFALAIGAAGAAAAVIFVLIKLFSRSGSVTGAVLLGIKAFFLKIWALLQAFAVWLSQFFTPEEEEIVPDLAPVMSIEEQEEYALAEMGVDPIRILVVAGIVIAVIALIVVFRLRKRRAAVRLASVGGTKIIRQKKKKKSPHLWKKLLNQFIFIKNVFLYRNTPPGVLVWLERLASRRKIPRGKGESVRDFITRLSPDGTLLALADDLDAGLYGKQPYSLSSKACLELKRKVRTELKQKNRGE